MEQFQESNLKAKKHLQTADHILSMTYPLIKDPKILLTVLDNINKSFQCMMDTVLQYDRLYKRIPIYADKFEEKYLIFKQKSGARYNFDPDFLEMAREIKETMQAHKKSPVEFARKNKFVICDDKYQTKTIEETSLKIYIAKAKLYHKIVQNVFKNDRIFN